VNVKFVGVITTLLHKNTKNDELSAKTRKKSAKIRSEIHRFRENYDLAGIAAEIMVSRPDSPKTGTAKTHEKSTTNCKLAYSLNSRRSNSGHIDETFSHVKFQPGLNFGMGTDQKSPISSEV